MRLRDVAVYGMHGLRAVRGTRVGVGQVTGYAVDGAGDIG